MNTIMMGRNLAWIVLVVLCLAVRSLATVYTVGDSSGWTIGVDYGTWAASKTFVVGDSLVFNYGSGHTVDEVKQSDYKTCTIGNSISTDNKGTTSILLQTPGTHFFICAILGHCGSGMKLSVNVLPSAAPSTSPTTSTTAAPSTTTTPTTTNGVYPTTASGTTPYMIPDSASSLRSVTSSIQGGLVLFVVVLVNFVLFL
ncbi:blue copper protein-like [Chenopodium quinoa]|uniref:blue copper protein-like n=1 Tax=Chenopodium quinoa TaxID=63459 RepID=UPI000B780B19|nr:blue copper protein-like [Chenopodium quinoa]